MRTTAPTHLASTMNARLSGVDTLRGVAAFAVLVCHAQAYCLVVGRPMPWPLPQIVNNGAHGVDLFIVVSGFCLALPVMRGQALIRRNFYIRRVFRLLPAYYVALAIAAGLALSASTARLVVGPQATVVDVLLHVFLLQSVVPGHIASINGSLWSVALEAQLYLLFPLTLFLFRKVGASIFLAACGALSVGWALCGALDVGTLGDEHLLPARLVQFVAGMWVAERAVDQRLSRPTTLWAVVAVGTCAGLIVSTVNLDALSAVIWAVPSAALLMAITHVPVGLLGPFERFGVITYSFYLLHQPVLLLLAPMLRRITQSPLFLLPLSVLLGWGCTAGVAWLLHRWVERPSQSFARRRPITVRPLAVGVPVQGPPGAPRAYGV